MRADDILNTLTKKELAVFKLRALYTASGYSRYKMSKFEEYDLYAKNKDFLPTEDIITFKDGQRLLALKPDVTLSIIKNDGDGKGKRKVYYHENVYRISAKTKQFKEIVQVGLECLGDIDLYDVFETVLLAAKSLAAVSERFVLDISHLGILSKALDEIGKGDTFAKEVMCVIAEKNAHGLRSLCESNGVSEKDTEKLLALIRAYGEPKKALAMLEPYYATGCTKEPYAFLVALCGLLNGTEYADRIRLDFSVVNDMNYYDDIVFKGFIDGIGEGVLSGGRYDKLMARMGKKSGAIGFATYLDALEGFGREKREADVDVLVLYDESVCVEHIAKTVNDLVAVGKTVSAQKSKSSVRYVELVDLRENKA